MHLFSLTWSKIFIIPEKTSSVPFFRGASTKALRRRWTPWTGSSGTGRRTAWAPWTRTAGTCTHWTPSRGMATAYSNVGMAENHIICTIIVYLYQNIRVKWNFLRRYVIGKEYHDCDQTIEILMNDLDPEVMNIFYKCNTDSASLATKVCKMRLICYNYNSF